MRLVAKFPVLRPPLMLGKELGSSGSSGVASGDDDGMLVRSGSEPPVFGGNEMHGTFLLAVVPCSSDGDMLIPGTSQDFGLDEDDDDDDDVATGFLVSHGCLEIDGSSGFSRSSCIVGTSSWNAFFLFSWEPAGFCATN